MFEISTYKSLYGKVMLVNVTTGRNTISLILARRGRWGVLEPSLGIGVAPRV